MEPGLAEHAAQAIDGIELVGVDEDAIEFAERRRIERGDRAGAHEPADGRLPAAIGFGRAGGPRQVGGIAGATEPLRRAGDEAGMI